MAENLKISITGQGLPLVFIHGWGLNSAVWQPVLEQLSLDFQIITVDLPGFGENLAQVQYPYNIEQIAQQIVSAVDKPAVYLGWSLGGLVATQISLTAKGNCLALVTVASSPHFVAKEDWPGIKPQILADFHQQLSTDIEKTIKSFLKIQAMGSPNIRHDVKLLQSLILKYSIPAQQTLDQSLSLLETVDFRQQLGNISVPFYRLYGRLDTLVPKQVVESIDLYTNSDFYLFDKASHAPFISNSQEFINVVKSWLDSHF